jgi:hypothetical protein
MAGTCRLLSLVVRSHSGAVFDLACFDLIARKFALRRAAAQRQLIARANVRVAGLVPVIEELKALGVTSMRGIAAGLDERGISTARGYGPWSPAQVSRFIKRIYSTVG